MKKIIQTFYNHLEEMIFILFFILLIFSLFFQVVSRLIGKPISTTEEISRFSYIWITFIGISYSAKLKNNISMKFFTNFFHEGLNRILNLFNETLELIIFIFLLYWSIKFCQFTAVLISPALEISMLFINISLPIGLSLAILRSIINIMKAYISKRT